MMMDKSDVQQQQQQQQLPKTRNEIILDNMPLVWYIARKYTNVDDDVISEGTLGLIHAVDRYDSGRNIRFSSYAYKCINGYMLKYFQSKKFDVSIDDDNDGEEASILDTLVDSHDFVEEITNGNLHDVRTQVIKEVIQLYCERVGDDRYIRIYARYMECVSVKIIAKELKSTVAIVQHSIEKVERILRNELPHHPMYAECMAK